MKNRIWVIILSLIALASCQSSRFMQDDMYFSSIDAKREVREYELNKSSSTKTEAAVKTNAIDNNLISNTDNNLLFDNYYDYTYSSRLRRFHTPNNTWAYYDPYYTNYYWYNNSGSHYFGNSVYSTYSWWSPYGPYAFNGWNYNYPNWNNGIYYNNMYYNSYDNNCYFGPWKSNDVDSTFINNPLNFVQLMQSNGISRDVTIRPDINYAAVRESKNLTDTVKNSNGTNNEVSNANLMKSDAPSISTDNKNTIVVTNNNSDNNDNSKSANSNTVNTNKSNNTTKRWDNYNTDVNISPNTNNNSNWSRSGVFSEGSRNNNYEYKGSTLPNDQGTNSNNKGTQNGKNPK